jgi:AmmeMemoRadiSam system protein B
VNPGAIRPAAVAGTFYPDDPDRLGSLVDVLLDRARALAVARPGPDAPVGLLVPHAGLSYSGIVAAAGWRWLAGTPATVVILGTNHVAGWLTGVGAWEEGAWETPLGEITVDERLARAIVALGPPFGVDRAAHGREHSIEVQLPILQVIAPGARIVPLTIAAGTGRTAIEAGRRLGRLLKTWSDHGRCHLVISSDMAHYPAAADCARTTELLLPAIVNADGPALAEREASVVAEATRGLSCGMCGIQPAVLGLVALAEWGAGSGVVLAAATSADAGGPPDRTVGYLSVAFPAGTV